MTKREMYERIIAIVADEEVKAFAKHEIELMDARNERRAGKPSKTAKENEPIKAKIAEFLKDKEEPVIAGAIAEEFKLSTQKVSALCTQMVKDGKLVAEDVKIKGKGTRKGYKVA